MPMAILLPSLLLTTQKYLAAPINYKRAGFPSKSRKYVSARGELGKTSTVFTTEKDAVRVRVRRGETIRRHSKDVDVNDQIVDGIGIVPYFSGKELLVTGATGFLGKVLIEKILREVPDVGKIYLMINATNEAAAMQRLETEIKDSKLFKLLQKTYGDDYDRFITSKLIPVVGNICDFDLGMQQDVACQVANKVDIIVSSAANTTFDDRFDSLMKMNIIGPRNLMSFAKGCKKLQLFLHVSTAYANGDRKGKIMEKIFRMGDNITREQYSQGQHSASSSLQPLTLDVEHEIELAFNQSNEASSENSSTPRMKELGVTRAKMFGWCDAYVFTKAMGEMMIDNMREDIPIVVIRPSIIESSLYEPFPGWIQGNRMLDPVIISYGKGRLTCFPGDPNCIFDVIPVDMVANTILAAIAKHGSIRDRKVNVYHVGTSVDNPILLQDILRLLYEHFISRPCMDSNGTPIKVLPFKLLDTIQDFSATIWRDIVASVQGENNMSAKQEIVLRRSIQKFERMANVYKPYTFFNGRFDTTNTKRLIEDMSEEERRKFNINVKSIDWEHYISYVHISGLKRHVISKGQIS